MKEKIMEWMILFFSSLLIPCVVTLFLAGRQPEETKEGSGIRVICEEGTSMDMEEFLIYMVAGQMNLEYETETLKVQAVIARTNFMRESKGKEEVRAEDLKISYLNPASFEDSFGEVKKKQVMDKLTKAVSATTGQVVTYEGEYIEALYHPVSIGNTVSSEEIYGVERAYLIDVPSSQDVESEEYMNVTDWTAEEVLAKLKEKGKNLKEEEVIDALKVKEKTANGYVKTVAAGKEILTGEEWQRMFSLPSTNFYLEGQEEGLRIITLGKGHGVGLSQYGANVLAMGGWDYEEILKKYYPGTSLEKTERKE